MRSERAGGVGEMSLRTMTYAHVLVLVVGGRLEVAATAMAYAVLSSLPVLSNIWPGSRRSAPEEARTIMSKWA